MKRIKEVFCVIAISFTAASAAAQTDSAKNLSNFLFPEFSKCIIKFKAGDSKTAVINYNVIDEELVFQQSDAYMVLDNPSIIDTIYVNDRKFVPVGSLFYEVVLSNPIISLFIQYKSIVEDTGVPTAYGASTKTNDTRYTKQIYGPIGSLNLSVPDNLKVTDKTIYWVGKDSSLEKFNTKRQFLKIFKAKEKELNQFIDSNNIDFKKPGDIIKVCNYYIAINK